MVRLKLIKGASFTGEGIKATRTDPYINTDRATADKVVALGYFEEISGMDAGFVPEAPASITETSEDIPESVPAYEENTEKEVTITPEELEAMTNKELREYAKGLGIDTEDIRKKSDIIAKILGY